MEVVEGGKHWKTGTGVRQLDAHLVEAFANWVETFRPTLQAHVPPEFPWFGQEQHVRAGALMQKLVAEASGEVPTVFSALQRNTKRGYGYHSHHLLCGSENLLRGRRSVVWREFRRIVARWPGEGQKGYFRNGFPHGREFVASEPNDCRFRITPIYSAHLRDGAVRTHAARTGSSPSQLGAAPMPSRAIVTYVVRYCMREDVDQAIEVLPARDHRETWRRFGL